MNASVIPNVLSVAGIDPSGGAGLYADLKAFVAFGAYGCGVVTALTAQNSQIVSGIHAPPPEFVRLQIDTLFADVRIDAAKTGMLATAAIVQAVAEGLAVQRTQGKLAHLVVDTVMVSKSGDELLTREAIAMLIEAVLPLATMMTPNLPEAGALLRSSPPDSLRDMQRAAERLRRLLPDSGQCWVLLKGGHLPGDAVDLLHDGDRMIEFSAPRIDTRNTHGTGCSLSAAITALLPRTNVPDAVDQAKRWLTQAISRSGELSVGQGHGPVHHLHRLWTR
jgi:hydroxymethylpyrimidine/phosphomethylpyrimidine kinase